MNDDQMKTIISCPECGTRLSVTTSLTDPKAFNCSNPSCRIMFTVLPDLSVHKGDHRKAYRQKVQVLSRIRSIQEQLSDIPETDAKEERELLDDLKLRIKAFKEKPSDEVQRLDDSLKERESAIRSQEEEIVRLKGEITALNSALDEARTKKAEQEKALTEISTTSSDPELEKKFRALQQKFKEQVATLKDWQSRLSDNERALSSAQKAVERAEIRIASYSDTERSLQERSILLDDREMDIEAREKVLQSKEKDIATREEGMRLCEDDLNKTKAELSDLEPLRDRIDREKEMLKREREDLLALKASIPVDEDDTSKRASLTIDSSRASEIERERIRLSEWEKELKTLEDRLSSGAPPAKTSAQDDQRFAKLKDALLKKNEEITALKASLIEAQTRPASSAVEPAFNAEMEERISLQKAELEARESTLVQRTADVDKRERELAAYSGQLTGYHAELTKRFEDFGREYSRYQEEKAGLEASSNGGQRITDEEIARLRKAEADASTLLTELDNAKGEIEKRNQVIIKMQEKLSRTPSSTSSAAVDQNALREKEAQIESLRSRVMEFERSISDMDRERSAAKESMERSLLEKAAEYGSNLSERERTISELRVQLDRAVEAAKAASEPYAPGSRMQNDTSDRVPALEGEITALKARISSLEGGAKEQTEAGSRQAAAIALLREKLAQSIKANRDLSDERRSLGATIDELRKALSSASDASAVLLEKDTRIAELEGGLTRLRSAVSDGEALDSERTERIAALTEELARVRAGSDEALKKAMDELESERRAFTDEQERLRKEAESGKERLRSKLAEVAAMEKRYRAKASESSKPETVFECPYCKSSINEKGISDGSCPSCGRKFKVAEEMVVEIFECPSCGRTLTKNAVSAGTCAFCGVRFHS